MSQRKTIKVTLPADKVAAFEAAKARAEHASMIAMSDTQYASRLIQWALDMQENGLLVISETKGGNICLYPTGPAGTVKHRQACLASQLLEEHWESSKGQ